MKGRGFEFAREIVDGVAVEGSKAFDEAKIPEYQTKNSAGADFFSVGEVEIPSIWAGIPSAFKVTVAGFQGTLKNCLFDAEVYKGDKEMNILRRLFQPTIIHTGIKAFMEPDEVLELYIRSSSPKKLGLVLANSVGVIDSDYYNNKDNDGEIMLAVYNLFPWSVHIIPGTRVGQGVFKKFLRPTDALVKDKERSGGYGSTN